MSVSKTPKKLPSAATNPADELAIETINSRISEEQSEVWDEERAFGLRLREDGTWERHPPKPSGAEPKQEITEPDKGSPYDEPAGYGDDKPIRTLTNFALYDEFGRLVPLEALELEAVNKVIAFGTLVEPSKTALKHPPPPPAERWRDPYTEAVLAQPAPTSIPVGRSVETNGVETDDTELSDALDLLDKLLVSFVTREALKSTGLAKLIYRLQRHTDAAIQDRALAIRMTWSDLLDRGGADQASVDLPFLQEATKKLQVFASENELSAPVPSSFSSSTFQLNTLINMDDIDEDDSVEMIFEPDRKKPRAGVNSAEIIAEYYFNGKTVEPSGPHESRLKQMVDYVRELLNCSEEELVGWRMAVHRRRKGNAFGQMDSYFFSPEGRRYRSRNEVGKAFEMGTFGLARSKGGRPPTTQKGSTGKGVPLAEPPKPSVVSPLANLNPVALPMPPVEDLDNIASSHPRRPFYECAYSAPQTGLISHVSQEARDLIRPPLPPDLELRIKHWEQVRANAQKKVVRVRLELTGWAISSDIGNAALYVHTEKAAYRLAGDLVIARPAPYYYSMFACSFLAFEACRLAVRVLTDFAPHVQYSRLTWREVMQEVLLRSRRVPGRSSPAGPRKLIVPISSLRFFYYPYKDRLTADFVASRQPLIEAIAQRHFARTPGVIENAPFSNELYYEHVRRSKLEEKNLAWALQEEQKRRASEKRRLLREEVRERERIAALFKRLEQECELRPEDSLLVCGSPSEIAKAATNDPLMAAALEKYLTATQGPAHSRPPLSILDFDPAFADGSALFEALDAGKKDNVVSILEPIAPSGAMLNINISDCERTIVNGRLLEVSPVSAPDEIGETFSRLLQIWDGACHFARAMDYNLDEVVGSFPRLRQQVYNARINARIFVDMLRAVAESDIERRTPPNPTVEDLCYHLASDPAFDSAYDTTVWPPPLWLVDETTWPLLLWSALCDWLRHHPEMAALESIEYGEITGDSLESLGRSAGLAVRDQAAPKDLDFIAICDDGLRALMLDTDADEFCRPVDRTLFPDYDQVIQRPMDLGTIRERIASGHYDPERAPPGAYEWSDETMLQITKKLESTRPTTQDSDDEDDDPDEKPSFNYLTLLSEYRSGGGSSNERPDCGKCKNCLDKPRFGGYNTLRQPCKLKQQAEQLQSAAASRSGDSNKKVKTKDLWKRRQAALAREEAMVKFDEMYLAHDSLGGGHEGLAADVRLVFRNCRVYNKGTTPIYRAASKLDSMFNAFYLRMVASRDPKYAIPRIVNYPEILARDGITAPAGGDESEDDMTTFSRVRRGFPSIVATVRELANTKDLALVPLKSRIVALEWLVDRALDTVKSKYLSARFMDARAVLADPAAPIPNDVIVGVEPPGVTHDMLRVWAVPHLVRETGGLVLFENLKTGQWLYLDDLQAFESFVLSLDPRGRRESLLKRNLERMLPEVEVAVKESSRDFAQALQVLKNGASELAEATIELETIRRELPNAIGAVQAALEEAKQKWEAKHMEEEEKRKTNIEERRKMWAEAKTEDGKVYYYNTLTRNTQWNRPKEMDAVFEPKSVPEMPETLPPAQDALDTLRAREKVTEAKIEQLKNDIAHAKKEIGRDRALLSFLKKLKVHKVSVAPVERIKGCITTCVQIATSLLALENFCLSAPEAQHEPGGTIWESEESRKAWIRDVEAFPRLCIQTDLEYVIKEAKRVVKILYDAFSSRGPFSRSDSFIRQRFAFEQWRWSASLDKAKHIGEIAICVAHLRRYFLDTLNVPENLAWARAKRREINVECS